MGEALLDQGIFGNFMLGSQEDLLLDDLLEYSGLESLEELDFENGPHVQPSASPLFGRRKAAKKTKAPRIRKNWLCILKLRKSVELWTYGHCLADFETSRPDDFSKSDPRILEMRAERSCREGTWSYNLPPANESEAAVAVTAATYPIVTGVHGGNKICNGHN